MNMILETPFLKAYERISMHYIFLIQGIYKYNRIDDYCTPGVIEANYHDIEKEIKELTKDKEAEKLFYGDTEESESSLIWQEILTNLYTVGADKIDAYIYFLLSPLNHILTAFERKKTEEDEYISKWLIQTGTFGDAATHEELQYDIKDFDDVSLVSQVSFFAVMFVCRLIAICNLLGYDVWKIANKFHIPIPRAFIDTELEMEAFRYSQNKIQYSPFFDRRKFGKTVTGTKLYPNLIQTLSPVLQRAIDAGFIEQISTGYKWSSGIISECAYFADLCNEKFNLSKRADATNWKPFADIFGFTTRQFREAKSGWKNKGAFPARRKEIEALFK